MLKEFKRQGVDVHDKPAPAVSQPSSSQPQVLPRGRTSKSRSQSQSRPRSSRAKPSEELQSQGQHPPHPLQDAKTAVPAARVADVQVAGEAAVPLVGASDQNADDEEEDHTLSDLECVLVFCFPAALLDLCVCLTKLFTPPPPLRQT